MSAAESIMPPIVAHVGNNVRDNQPHRIETDVCGLFRALHEQRGDTKDGRYFQLVDYVNGAHRDLEHVGNVYGYTVDLDHGDWGAGDIRDTMGGIRCSVYSTFSSKPGARKWRIVVPFAVPVSRPVFETIHRLRFAEKFGGDLDERCGHAAQIWYMRRCAPDGGHDDAFELDGDVFDPTPFYEAAEAPEVPKPKGTTNQHDGETWGAGDRNNKLTSLAGKMRRQGFSGDEIEAALLAANTGRCRPPLADAEVRAIARSVSRYEPADRPPVGHDEQLEDGDERPEIELVAGEAAPYVARLAKLSETAVPRTTGVGHSWCVPPRSVT